MQRFKHLTYFLFLLGALPLLSDEPLPYGIKPPPIEAPIQPPPSEIPSTALGEWRGLRTSLRNNGFNVKASLILDDSWTVNGGKHITKARGDWEYLFDARMEVNSEPLFHYSGGRLLVDFQFHHGLEPSKDAGCFVPLDTIEAFSFNSIYALWYKQLIKKSGSWLLVGKSDGYDNFTTTAHSLYFIYSGYTTLPTLLFFPTYPDPAMSFIGLFNFPFQTSLTVGLFDGSLAEGVHTGKLGVFGHFFDHLDKHAMILAEIDVVWQQDALYKGRLGIGGWKTTAKIDKFDGGTLRGTSGPYLTVDQIFYKTDKSEGGLFFDYGFANPVVSPVQHFFGLGINWQGAIPSRSDDSVGIGLGRSNFSHSKGSPYTESNETSYEIYYVWQPADFCYIQPDFQYITHPGGQGLPAASVFTIRLQMTL